MPNIVGAGTDSDEAHSASARAWFAGGELIGYDANARAIVQASGAPLSVFLRREGDLTHAVSLLPGFPDGSFGWPRSCRTCRTRRAHRAP
jgi:hypothetical protein